MAISEYAYALSALLGTLLILFAVRHRMLRFKRRVIRGYCSRRTAG